MATYYFNQRDDLFVDGIDFKRFTREYQKFHPELTKADALDRCAILLGRRSYYDLRQVAKANAAKVPASSAKPPHPHVHRPIHGTGALSLERLGSPDEHAYQQSTAEASTGETP